MGSFAWFALTSFDCSAGTDFYFFYPALFVQEVVFNIGFCFLTGALVFLLRILSLSRISMQL